MSLSEMQHHIGMMNSQIYSNAEKAKNGPKDLRAEVLSEKKTAPDNIQARHKAYLEEKEEKVTLSDESISRLRGDHAKAAQEEKDSHLPEHIRAMRKEIKKLKEQIEEKKEELEKLKRESNLTPQELEAHTKELVMLQEMYQTMKLALMEALDKAGISDPAALEGI